MGLKNDLLGHSNPFINGLSSVLKAVRFVALTTVIQRLFQIEV